MEKLESYAIKKVAKGGVIIFIAIMLSSLAFLFYRIIAARYLGPSDYGMLTLGIVILKITTIFGLLGIHMSIGKFISHYLARKQYGEAKGLLIAGFSVTIFFSLFLWHSVQRNYATALLLFFCIQETWICDDIGKHF